MEFGSFFSPPFRAGCNKQTFLFPFHPSVVCSSASALLALSLLTAIPIRKPEPGGKWRDCIDTADHWAPHNWQLFLSFTSGDELNRLCKIWWLPKRKGGRGRGRDILLPRLSCYLVPRGLFKQHPQHRKQKWKIRGSEQIRWFQGMFVQKSERLNTLLLFLCGRMLQAQVLPQNHPPLSFGSAVSREQAEPCTTCLGKCSARTQKNQCQEQWLTFERVWACRTPLTDAVFHCSAASHHTGYGPQ